MAENNNKKKNCFNYTKIWMPILIVITLFAILFGYHFLQNIKPYSEAINKNTAGVALAQKDINYLKEGQHELSDVCKELRKTMQDLNIAVTKLEAKL